MDEFVVNYVDRLKDKKLVSIDSESDLEKSLFTKVSAAATSGAGRVSTTEEKDLETFIKDVLGEKVSKHSISFVYYP